MRASRPPFNPFIVLSDVTIATMVVLACLLMIFSQMIGRQRLIERRREQAAQRIATQQEALFSKAKRNWPRDLAVSNARGLNSYLYRFPGKLFDPARPERLSRYGRKVLETWARTYAPRLQALQGDQPGSLIEIQVRGHCRRGLSDPDWLAIRRAMDAVSVLEATPQFPVHLVSVSGASWYRRAYESTEAAQQKGHSRKTALEDRIDILLVFAGDERDNNFVAAFDGTRTYGPLNDVSTPELWTREGARP